MERALLTGLTGQDGSFLAELLLSKGIEVHGIRRRVSTTAVSWRIDHIFDSLHLHYGDLCDPLSLRNVIAEVRPDYVFNLGSQSHVAVSFEVPHDTANSVFLGTVALLDACRAEVPECRFYQASSSEMFGSSPPPQNERTEFRPMSPYACAKVAAHHYAVMTREAYGMHVSCGILFNHESSRRAETFVTRKIARAAARIKTGLQSELRLGNLDARRDWGYAGDYVEAMWLMLQQDEPDDYVIATGESHSVRDFLDEAFGCLDLDWRNYVVFDERYARPLDVPDLCGDSTKARQKLGWRPEIGFRELVRIMVDAEMKRCG